MPRENGEIFFAMNSITRIVSGLLSSLLLAAGFVRAADRLDPINNSLRLSNHNHSVGVASPCTVPCALASNAT